MKQNTKETVAVGEIIRVAGPLVQATGLGAGAKMYEVVHVGKQGLIGEIIEIQDDVVSIQVYEETGGIVPGEPVEATGSSLSIELGPGLVKSIYDGIQRPLDVIRSETGDFILRGVKAPGLDRNKKWHFKPVAKNGQEVSEFSILGEVAETEAVLTKIMAPPGISGIVRDLHEGDFTVTDKIGSVGGKEVNLMFRWPVRTPLPCTRKIEPSEPLVTGTRVIDTFFPVAKGGTACIPGPFGSGKCVDGETPVSLADGQKIKMSQLYEKLKKHGKHIKGRREEWTMLSSPFFVYGYKDGKIGEFPVSAVYKGFSSKMIEIETTSGRRIKVTPIHKLIAFSDLNEIRKQAKELREGDYLLMPRKLPLFKKGVSKIPWKKIFKNYRVTEKKVLEEFCGILSELKKKQGSLKNISQNLGVSYDCLIGYWLGKNNPPLNFVLKTYKRASKKHPQISLLKGNTSSLPTKFPKKFSKNLALFLGLLAGDGQVKGRSIRFYNNSGEIAQLYIKIVQEIFGITPGKVRMKTVMSYIFESPVVRALLNYYEFPEYKKSLNVKAPLGLFSQNRKIAASFLAGVFLTDGFFDRKKGEIEISTSSKSLFEDIAYILLSCGILASFRKRKQGKFESCRIFIRRKEELGNFYKLCNLPTEKFREIEEYLKDGRPSYNRNDIVPLSPEFILKIYKRFGKPYSKLHKSGVEIFNYLAGENMSRMKFRDFARTLGEDSLMKFATNHLGEIFIDKVKKVKWINTPQEVYDIEVRVAHNFIGGEIPAFYSNTVVLHQLAKWSDADVVVYVGCGERGNEMTDVLTEFPELIDPKSGRPLLEKTVLIANTSNMPVAAREASIYTGITLAEFFRNMGFNVAIMADSTSRWAEALREMSGRLEEMPGEEGYPAYLASRIAAFYERSGLVEVGMPARTGSVSVVGAVSPPGGDLSDPVVQSTLRMVKVFWALEAALAYQRHFPAINWLNSYSLYIDEIEEYYNVRKMKDFLTLRKKALKILQQEAELQEIVRLVGIESLSAGDRIILDVSKTLREDFLHQHAFDPKDAYSTLEKQYRMLSVIMLYYEFGVKAVGKGLAIKDIVNIPSKEKIAGMKYMDIEQIDEAEKAVKEDFGRLMTEGEVSQPLSH